MNDFFGMTNKIIRNNWAIFFFVILGFMTRFFNISYPARVVFDEVSFGSQAMRYFSHLYYFDIHPPLGKLLFAVAGWLGGAKPGFEFAPDQAYSDFPFFAMRALPAILGAVLPLLVYLFTLRLGFSKKIAFFAGFMVLFDNALLVQSRFILLDMFYIFFVSLSLYLFLIFKKEKLYSRRWYTLGILCGILIGAAGSIKFIGFGALLIVWLWIFFEEKHLLASQFQRLVLVGFFLLIPLIFYFLVFFIHFSLLPLDCNADCGDAVGRKINIAPPAEAANIAFRGNFIEKFLPLNIRMVSLNVSLVSNFAYQSSWYSWPFLIRPVQYLQQELSSEKVSSVYLLGNPLVWWSALLGLIGFVYIIFRNCILRLRQKPAIFYQKNVYFLFLSYLVFLLPFASLSRFTVIYHYLTALIFSFILFAVFLEGILSSLPKRAATVIYCGLLLIYFISFLYFAPFSYGIPLSERGLESRMWLPTWSYAP